MNLPNVGRLDSLNLLFTLLPGLLTFLVIRLLTARERRIEPVEAILHGLGYALLVNAIWAILVRSGSLIPTPDIVGLSLSAVGLGLFLAWVGNRGWLYDRLRKLGLTSESSWSSTWQTAFKYARNNLGEYCVLCFKDGRRILGGVVGYSNEQNNGHICLGRAKWLTEDIDRDEEPGLLMFCAEDVECIQFLDAKSEKQNHDKGSKAQETSTSHKCTQDKTSEGKRVVVGPPKVTTAAAAPPAAAEKVW